MIERTKEEKKYIVMIGEKDCCGLMYRWKTLLKNRDWDMDYFVTNNKTSYGFPNSSTDMTLLKDSLDKSDVIFWHRALKKGEDSTNFQDDSDEFDIDWSKYKDKTFIFLNGSVNLRVFARKHKELYKEFKGIVATTPDLCWLFDAKYVPQPIVMAPGELDKTKFVKPWFATQHPTNRAIKDTNIFISACEKIKAEYPGDFDYKVESGLQNAECLEEKEFNSHIEFEHLGGYFSVNALESAWLGQVVICHIDDKYEQIISEFTGTHSLPFWSIDNPDGVYNSLKMIMKNPDFIYSQSKFAQDWMKTYWNGDKHFENLVKIIS